jgi:soluble lytic murein transglycosylase-like protein
MKRILLIITLLWAPLSAQEHLEAVYHRENTRLDMLLDWSPGDKRPVLPPIIKFDATKLAVQAKPAPVQSVQGIQRETSTPQNYTAWIVEYNRSISLGQADLISRMIVGKAQKQGIDPKLIVALVAAESAFRIDARSPVGAQGLGQLMPGTAAMLGVSRPYDPGQNLDGTVRYFATQLRRWGSPALALASYNAGPGAVQKYGGIPPYRETQEYVHYVLKLHRELESLERQQRAVSRNNNQKNGDS